MKKLKFILDWIIKAYKYVKDWIGFVVQIIAVVGIVTTFLSVKGCINNKEEKINVINILTSKVETFKTESGKSAAKVDNWQIKCKALERLNGEISHENNVYLDELTKAKETINDLDLRLKDVKNYIKTDLVSRDSIETNIIFLGDPCRFKLEPIEQEFLSLKFEQDEDYNLMGIDYESRNSISTLLTIYPKRIDNQNRIRYGKKHFPNWGKIWGWDHTVVSVVKNPKSKITNTVSIEFTK